MATDEVIFFNDVGDYGRGRRLRESDRIRREIEALRVSLWSSPDAQDRKEIDAQVEVMRQRIAHLEAHPDEDRPR